MTKKEFRFNAKSIDSLKQSMSSIKNDAIKGIARQVLDNQIGGLVDDGTRWPKVIAGHTKHVQS